MSGHSLHEHRRTRGGSRYPRRATRRRAGEIIVHGPEVFEGYWQRPDATQAVFIEKEGKRFFRTGDLGHVDADGYFFLTDRLKRMINASGFKVWPAEVEALMFRHPAIQEACVIGCVMPTVEKASKRWWCSALRTRIRRNSRSSTGAVRTWPPTRRPHCAGGGCLAKSGSGKVMWRALQEAQASAS